MVLLKCSIYRVKTFFGKGLLFIVFLLASQMLSAKSKIDSLLVKGDSLLNINAFHEARGVYEEVSQLSDNSSDLFYKRLSQYKKAFSYIVEREKDSASYYFNKISFKGCEISPKDSGLKFLVNRELDDLESRYLDSEYDYYKIIFDYYNLLPYLDKHLKDNLTYIMAVLDFKQGHFKMSIVKFEKVIKSPSANNFFKDFSLFLIAGCHMSVNDFKKSNTYFQELISNKSKYISYYSISRYIANNYYFLGDYKRAIEIYLEILQESTPNDMSDLDLLEVLSQLGNCYMYINSYDEAEAAFKKHKTLIKLDQNSANRLVYHYLIWSSLYLKQNNIKKTKEILDEAGKVIDSYNVEMIFVVQFYKKIAEYYFYLEQFEEVLKTVENFNKKYKTSLALKTKSRVKMQYRYLLAFYYDSMVNLWTQDETAVTYLIKALKGYEDMLLITNSYFNNIMEEDSKYKYVVHLRADYEKIFLTSYYLYQITKDEKYLEKIYNSLEKSKAYLFDGSIKYQKQALEYNFPEDFISLKWELKKRFDRINFEMMNMDSFKESEQVQLHRELSMVRARYDSVLREEENIINKYEKENLFDFRELPKMLKDNQIVLDYLLTVDGRLFLSMIDSEKSQLIEIKPKHSVKELATQFRKMIIEQGTKSHLTEKDLCNYKDISFQLYNCLFGTLKPYIKNKQIIIIPDKELAAIPFDALIVDTTGRNFSDLNYMVKNYNISELYSINQLYESNINIQSPVRVFGFAPDYGLYNQDSISLLPGAMDEVKSLDKYFRGDFYYEEKANSKNFLKAKGNYDIVHFALHTDVNSQKPDFSTLLFTEPGESLPVFEIYGTNWNAKLLVLSGCSTGDGAIKWGEGMISLARVFFFVGVKNIVATKWVVADYSGSQLMDNFYMELKEKESVGEALQKAKIDFLNGGDPLLHHPYYWASYFSVGHPVSFEKRSICRYVWLVVGGVVVLSILIVMIRKKKAIKIAFKELIARS